MDLVLRIGNDIFRLHLPVLRVKKPYTIFNPNPSRKKMLDFERLVKEVGGLQKVAALAGRSRTAVYHWRKNRDMRIADLERICSAAGLDARDFIVEDDQSEVMD